jgi:hypothetical protein
MLPMVDDRYIGRLARHMPSGLRARYCAAYLNRVQQHPVGVRVSILTQSMSCESLDDLDGLATAYANAWTAATAARRGRLRNELICRCLPFAARMARRYMGRGEPLEDLQQVARIGLIKAVTATTPAAARSPRSP